MIRAVVIDDDEIARKVIVSFIERTEGMTCIGEFNNAIDAIPLIENKDIDLFFLDVEMPEMSGFDFLNYGKEMLSQVVLVTSKEKYAVQAFEYDIADYLVKPIEYSRFLQAVKKVRDNISQPSGKNKSNAIFVKEGSVYTKLKFENIKWLEASGDYVSIVTDDKNYLVHTTMKVIEQQLPEKNFVRVHRSYIINISNLNNFDKEFCIVNKKMIPIGKSYRKVLLSRLNVI